MRNELSLEKLDDDFDIIMEKQYKTEVAVNTILSLLIKKKMFTKEEFKEEMKEIRQRVRDE